MSWIPIEQQLPDDDLDVLVYGPEIEVLDQTWLGHMDGDLWYDTNLSRINVTHWMHLPGPPISEDRIEATGQITITRVLDMVELQVATPSGPIRLRMNQQQASEIGRKLLETDVAEVVVVTDGNSGDEALYINGKLVFSQDTYYSGELIHDIGEGRLIRIRHQPCDVTHPQDQYLEFPEKLEDLASMAVLTYEKGGTP